MEAVRAFAPGRTELAGNHTDHQGGRVIAAAVDCGVEMMVQPNSSTRARVASEGFAPFEIELVDVSPREDERFTTAALVRGVVAGLRAMGVSVEGFDAQVTSTVPSGGGLSSSAAFELALAQALCDLASRTTGTEGVVNFSSSRADSVALPEKLTTPSVPVVRQVQLAKIGQAAERDWFGKACGLMYQLAVALGGIVAIDFAGDEPQVERIDFDFERAGYAICLVDTHCDHSRYTDDYSQVSLDMSAVAELLGARVLSQVPEEAFFGRFEEVRDKLGDVPALRGLHYYHENRLVDARARALREGDIDAFLHFTRVSGSSSAQYLQNVSTFDRASQPAMVALALADKFLGGQGAVRIHGGGFGGSIQAFVPLDRVEAFIRWMDAHLGDGSCRAYRVTQKGACMGIDRCTETPSLKTW